MFFFNSWYLVSYPCKVGPSIGFFNPQQVLTTVLPKRLFQTIHSLVELAVPDCISPAKLTVPDCSFPAEAAAPQSSTPDRCFQSQIDDLFPGSITSVPYRCLLPPAESSLVDYGFQNYYRFPQQQVFSVVLSPSHCFGISSLLEHRVAGHFPTSSRALCISNSLARVQKMVIISPVDPLASAWHSTQHFASLHVESYCIANRVAFPFSWSITPLKNSNIRM